MRRALTMTGAAMIALGVSAAHSDSVTGPIQNLDPVSGSFMIGDETFRASPNNTVGPSIDELEEGDVVEVYYVDDSDDESANAMRISREEDAGRSDEVMGSVEKVDADERILVVDGRSFIVVDNETKSASLDDLKEGDDVVVIFAKDSADEPVEAYSIYKIN